MVHHFMMSYLQNNKKSTIILTFHFLLNKLREMAGYQIRNQYHTHYLTLTIVGWADVFTRKTYKDIIIESMAYCQKEKGLIIYAYVIMSNHLHLIAAAKAESKGLSAILGDFKRHTAKQILKNTKTQPESRREWLLNIFAYHAKYNSNNSNYQVWLQHNRPIELISPKWIKQKLNYIHQNPVRAGLVAESHHYLYSSATNYRDGKGLLDITIIDLGITNFYIFMGDQND